MLAAKLQPFAVSLLIGLAVGIERERRTSEGKGTMGVRTIAIVGLSGTVAGQIGSAALTAGLMLLLTIAIALGYQRVTSQASASDIGLTTEITAGLVFALGYLATSELLLTAILGVVLVTVLYSRRYLHAFSREVLRPADIASALILAVFSLVILPLLPDRFIDPWKLINPRSIGQIIILVGGVEFGGYIIDRLLGPRIGSLAAGFFGGLVSSTAVFLNMARLSARDSTKIVEAIANCSSATVATLLLFVAIVGLTSSSLLVSVGVPALAVALVMGGFGFLISRRLESIPTVVSAGRSPLDIRGVLKLSVFVVGLLALTAMVKRYLGPAAVEASSFVSGLFEVHATTFAAATLHAAGELEPSNATRALLLAASASLLSKTVIGVMIGSRRFAFIVTLAIFLAGIVGAGVFTILVALNIGA